MSKDSSSIKSKFSDTLKSLTKEDRLDMEANLLVMQFIGIADERMEEGRISKKELAEKVGTSASYITQVFRANRKPNWLFLAKVQEALDLKFEVSTVERRNEWMKEELMDYHNRWRKSSTLSSRDKTDHNESLLSIERNEDYALAG